MASEAVGVLEAGESISLGAVTYRGMSLEDKVKFEVERFVTANLCVNEAVGLLLDHPNPSLRYHGGVSHTYDVLEEAIRLALMDCLPEHEVELIAIGAAFHDTGFIIQRSRNEAVGASLAARSMKTHGYCDDDIRKVEAMISDTAITVTKDGIPTRVSSSNLSDYLLDADVANLGREDFFEQNRKLYCELQGREVASVIRELEGPHREEALNFLGNTFRLLANHEWKSPAAKKLMTQQHQQNIRALSVVLSMLQ